MEGWYSVLQSGCWILLKHILLQASLKFDLPGLDLVLAAFLLVQGQSVSQWIIDVGVVRDNVRLDPKLLPSLLCPQDLAVVLASKVRSSCVVPAPFLCLLLLRRGEQDSLKLFEG